MFKIGDIVENTIDREFFGKVLLKAGEKGTVTKVYQNCYNIEFEGKEWVFGSAIGGLSLVENYNEKKEETKSEIIQPKFIQGEIVSNNGEEYEIIERYSFCINGEVLGYIYDIKGKNRIFTKVAEQNLNKIDKTVISKEKEVNVPDVDSYYESVHRLAVEIAKETTYTTAQIQDFIETCDILHGDIEYLKKCIKIGTPTIEFYFDLLREYGDKNLERVKKEFANSQSKNKTDIHQEICNTLNALYRAKNADYGDSFANTRKVVSNAILVRLNDKISRLNSLMRGNKQQVKDESIKDTLMDLANYAILELVEMECEK